MVCAEPSAKAALRCGDEGGHFDLDLGPHVDEPVDEEQCRGRKVSAQRLLPCRPDAAAGSFILAAAREIPGQTNDVLWPGTNLRKQLDDALERSRDLCSERWRIVALLVAAGLACQHDPSARTTEFDTVGKAARF